MVDHFDAMTSDRPYHKAMTRDAALGLLTQEAGNALDPTVVETFISHAAQSRTRPPTRWSRRRPPPLTGTDLADRADPPQASSPRARSTTVFDDIAHAHREIYALYEIAQTMGTSLGVADTMALITSKLISLVPVQLVRAVPLR